MTLNLPSGKRLAVSIGADFDAHSVWMGNFGLSSPSYLSRGEFGAEVGVPRLLDLFGRYSIMETFPGAFQSILDIGGHEIAAHGCYHESVPKLDRDEERRLMDKALAVHERIIGKRPRGYRSPAWDFTEHTLDILQDNAFDWDSSLMGRDFEPYHPRPVTVRWEEGSIMGEPSPLLEIPVSWYLDDFPAVEYIPGINAGLGSAQVVFERWKDNFDYAYQHAPSGVIAFTVHPQTIGRAHHILMFERLVDYMVGHDGAWFATLSDIYDTWTDD